MAASKAVMIVSFLLLSLFVFHDVDAGTTKIDCEAACAGRCRLASRQKMCKRACATCCARCNCVPPGTYGNRDSCPCYAKMTTHNNRLKCP